METISLHWVEKGISNGSGGLASAYECKVVGKIGPGPEDAKSMRVLNRVLSWTEEGLELEGDQRHADIVVDMLGLEKCKGTATPGIKVEEAEGDHEELSAEEATKFREITARINFLAQDRPELLYATKEACRHMAKPTVGAWEKVKRLGKYSIKAFITRKNKRNWSQSYAMVKML